MDNNNYKKVLLISNIPITPYSAQGASRGSWFRDWDKDKLGLMTFCKADKKDGFCNFYFTITRQEKLLISLFDKNKSQNKTSNPSSSTQIPSKNTANKSTLSKLKSDLHLLLNTIMLPRYSPELKQFLSEFKPDIIFSTVGDVYGARLARFISKKIDIPYIIQQEDNWLTSDLANDLFSKLVYKIRYNGLKKSLKYASRRYAICPNMKKHFEKQLNMHFDCLLCADEPDRFLPPEKYNANKKTQFLYIGNSQPGRSSGYVKIAKAIVDAKIKNPEFVIYSNNADKQDIIELKKYDFVKFLDTPHHDDVASAISKANVLLLCESFEDDIIEYTKLALSSKIQIYMMAKIPMLIFAPKETGVMDYALKENFACTVFNDDQNELLNAVYQITHNQNLRDELVVAANNVALKNHDAYKIRNDLKKEIDQIS